MSDPWLEQWTYVGPLGRDGVTVVLRIDGSDPKDGGSLALTTETFATKHYVDRGAAALPARAKLAAMAPRMARTLLRNEWGAFNGPGGFERWECGACGAPKTGGKHRDACDVDEDLRELGFDTQERRDVARTAIGLTDGILGRLPGAEDR
jgi:hypothetical protein